MVYESLNFFEWYFKTSGFRTTHVVKQNMQRHAEFSKIWRVLLCEVDLTTSAKLAASSVV